MIKCTQCNSHLLIADFRNNVKGYEVVCSDCGKKYKESLTISGAWENAFEEVYKKKNGDGFIRKNKLMSVLKHYIKNMERGAQNTEDQIVRVKFETSIEAYEGIISLIESGDLD